MDDKIMIKQIINALYGKQIINSLYGKMPQHNFIYADTDSIHYSDCDSAEILTLLLYLFYLRRNKTMKYRPKLSNDVNSAKWNRIKLTHLKNSTTNSTITPAMFKRECKEYDAGTLPFEHDVYIGERYA